MREKFGIPDEENLSLRDFNLIYKEEGDDKDGRDDDGEAEQEED